MGATFDQQRQQWVYDHDLAPCNRCHRLTGDDWYDGPCPGCGHTTLRVVTTYGPSAFGRPWKFLWGLCDGCRIRWLQYAGSTIFSPAETGGGADVSDYTPVGDGASRTQWPLKRRFRRLT